MRDPTPLYKLVDDVYHLAVPHRLLPFPRREDFNDEHWEKTEANIDGTTKNMLKTNTDKPMHVVGYKIQPLVP